MLVCGCGGESSVLTIAEAGVLLPPPDERERITALTDARLIVIHAYSFERLLSRPDDAAAISAALLEALQDRQESLAQLACGARPLAERLRAKLCQLGRRHGRGETVTHALAALEATGFLRREDGAFWVNLPPEALIDRGCVGAALGSEAAASPQV